MIPLSTHKVAAKTMDGIAKKIIKSHTLLSFGAVFHQNKFMTENKDNIKITAMAY